MLAGDQLSGSNVAVALLANTLATVASLVTLILTPSSTRACGQGRDRRRSA